MDEALDVGCCVQDLRRWDPRKPVELNENGCFQVKLEKGGERVVAHCWADEGWTMTELRASH